MSTIQPSFTPWFVKFEIMTLILTNAGVLNKGKMQCTYDESQYILQNQSLYKSGKVIIIVIIIIIISKSEKNKFDTIHAVRMLLKQ